MRRTAFFLAFSLASATCFGALINAFNNKPKSFVVMSGVDYFSRALAPPEVQGGVEIIKLLSDGSLTLAPKESSEAEDHLHRRYVLVGRERNEKEPSCTSVQVFRKGEDEAAPYYTAYHLCRAAY